MANVANSINLLRFDTTPSTHSVQFYPLFIMAFCIGVNRCFLDKNAIFWTKNLVDVSGAL
jgi:hypothetical protein